MKKLLALILSLAMLVPSIAIAAAPAVDLIVTSVESGNVATHDVTLADTSDACTTGDLHVAILSIDSQSSLTGSWGSSFARPTGLAALYLDANEPNAPALDIGYKLDAGENTVVWTISAPGGATERSAHAALCVSGWDEATAPKVAVQDDTNDPPELTFGGTCDALIITGLLGDDGQAATGAPSGYGSLTTSSSGSAGSGASLSIAVLQVTGATSADPGAFTSGTASGYTAFTLAILNGCTAPSGGSAARRRHGA